MGGLLYRVFLLRLSARSALCNILRDITTACNMAVDSTELLTLVLKADKPLRAPLKSFMYSCVKKYLLKYFLVSAFSLFFVCIFVTFTRFRSDLSDLKSRNPLHRVCLTK